MEKKKLIDLFHKEEKPVSLENMVEKKPWYQEREKLSEDDFTKPGEAIPRDAGIGDFMRYNVSHFDPMSEENVMGFAGMSGGIKSKAAADKLVKYLIKKRGENYLLQSKKGYGEMTRSSPEEMASYDKTLESHDVKNPFKIEILSSKEPGYGKKILNKLEEKAIKEGADSIYLNASPIHTEYGAPRLQKNDLVEFYKSRGFEVVNDEGGNAVMIKTLDNPGLAVADPRFKKSGKIMAGTAGALTIEEILSDAKEREENGR